MISCSYDNPSDYCKSNLDSWVPSWADPGHRRSSLTSCDSNISIFVDWHSTLNAVLYYSIKIKAAMVLNFLIKSEHPSQGKAKQISMCRGDDFNYSDDVIREASKERFAWHVLTRIKLLHVKRSVEQLYYWNTNHCTVTCHESLEQTS